jgi:hypothetical protein
LKDRRGQAVDAPVASRPKRAIRLVLSAEAGRRNPGKSRHRTGFAPPPRQRYLSEGAQLADNADSMAGIDARLASSDRAGKITT